MALKLQVALGLDADDRVEGAVTDLDAREAESFSGWLDLLRVLEARLVALSEVGAQHKANEAAGHTYPRVLPIPDGRLLRTVPSVDAGKADDSRWSFLVERYFSPWVAETAETALVKDREAARSAAAAGLAVRHVRTVCVPGDERCFSFFQAASAGVLREANERAGLHFDRIIAVEEPVAAPRGEEVVESEQM